MVLLVLSGVFLASSLLTIYFDWPAWKGGIVFFLLGIFLVITFYLLINIRVLSKWLWHRIRKLFRFNSRFKYINWQSFIKGLDIQGRRWFMPLKWFRATPSPWYLMVNLFNSDCDQLLQDRNMAAMRFMPGHRRKSSKACRWWFFHNVMYLSIPGHFIYKNENIAPTWRYLVRWIWLWCRPPAGVIVTLPANILHQNMASEHHAHARLLRDALGLLFKRLAKRLPIYLMMTNLQRLAGAEQWLACHDETQPTGMTGVLLNSRYDERVNYQVSRAMESIFQSLCLQRLNLLNNSRALPDENFLLFPETIKKLQGPLANFLSPLCEKDIYMEYGVLSGIFLTAFRRDQQGEVHGIFSQYLLENAIPAHQVSIRYQCVPGAWWLIRQMMLIMLGGSLCFTAVKSFRQIKNDEDMLSTQQAASPIEKNYLRFAEMSDLKEQRLYRWFFNPALNWMITQRAREYQHNTASQEFLPGEINNQILARLHKVNISQQAKLIINWAAFINTEQQMDSGASLQTLNEMPEYSASLLSAHPVSLTFEQLLAKRMAARILGEKQYLPAWRKTLRVMIASKPNLSWLLAVPLPEGSHDVRLSDYWPAFSAELPEVGLSADKARQVSWIFTQQGERYLSHELDILQQACGDTVVFHQLREVFWQEYLLKRQNAWINFANQLLLTEPNVTGKENWHELLLSVMHTESPYDRFMADLSVDLSTIGNEQALPWLLLFRDFQRQKAMLGQSGLFSALERNRMLIRGRVRRYQRLAVRNSSFFSDSTLVLYKKYLDSVQNLAHQVEKAPKNTARLLNLNENEESRKTETETVNSMFTNFSQWHRASTEKKDSDLSTQVLWDLFQGNARLLRDYIVLSAADQLQYYWNTSVSWPLNAKIAEQGADAEGIEKDLYQHIVTFIQKNAEGLLVFDEEGIRSNHWQEQSLPLTVDFISYINEYIKPDSISGQSTETRKRLLDEKAQLDQRDDSNKVQSQDATQNKSENKPAVLNIAGRPATANWDATLLPVGTSLRLICSDGDQFLNNMNFNTQAKFNWKPQYCSDVILTITFPKFNVQKIYPGREGLVDFLQDYSSGEHRYVAEDFPVNSEQLKHSRVNLITVRYQLSGQNDILSSLEAWNTEQQQQLSAFLKREDINTQLNTIDTPSDSSGILSALPKNITTTWQLAGYN
ncbi:type VI secretion system protein ImpL [Enterobacter kobei]|uniref:type VI secretion protein IcmF/TssM N-terminal domain-containing protein n=1 Tax=Enterobacter kobei TaxID=208224 RepID=UPI0012548B24|nr:type VI secretion protein IcmF/TssM N-terminal domain-containing protein [Enterobacter kobei]VAL43536.1 type VI secretion system protein ImpL [Enterobacter kobei]